MTTTRLPLAPILEETVLPGEERSLDARLFPEGSIAWLNQLEIGSEYILLAVSAFAEVPVLAGGRFATRVIHRGFDVGRPRVSGESRVRLTSVKGSRTPFDADHEPTKPLVASRLPELVLRAAAALSHGPPRAPDADFVPLAVSALQLLGGPPSSRIAMQSGNLEQALTQATETFVAESSGRAAVAQIEEQIRTLAANPTLGKSLRQRLHSAVVEVSRRLDLYDTHKSKSDDLDELDLLRRHIEQGGLPTDARALAEREMSLLRDMKKEHHDYSTHLRLLQLMARLAWHPDHLPALHLSTVKSALDVGHAGLERPKRRILEHLAVRSLGGESRSTVLCLAGPPGVGKTSIATAIAKSIGRPFVRIALGGVHDEAELRGHRITFTAARAGRVIDGLARLQSRSALVLLDEIDKIGTDRSRDAIGPLLEILDPEQNHAFSDNFLSVPYDLSDCLFIATANDVSRIPDFLRDRLEIIPLEGYTTREKISIATNHLASEMAREHGIDPLTIADDLIAEVIEGWTYEAGVRQLRRELGAFYRERAVEHVETLGQEPPADVSALRRPVTAADLPRVLGPRRHLGPSRVDVLPPGVALGLSVSGHGGQVLRLEIAKVGTSEKLPGGLAMTGSLGSVMRESAELVRAHLMAYRTRYELPDGVFGWNLHLHAPEAAVPKDGPSAGVALFLAMVSLYTGRAVRADVALTGEIGLSGQVLPVGGIRAKCLAAERSRMSRVFLPRANEADVPTDLKIAVTYLDSLEDALVALEPARTES